MPVAIWPCPPMFGPAICVSQAMPSFFCAVREISTICTLKCTVFFSASPSSIVVVSITCSRPSIAA